MTGGLLDNRILLRIGAGSTWVDVTARVEQKDAQLEYTWGASGEFGDIAPATWSFELSNADGLFTPDNPASGFYGRLVEGVEVRWIAGVYMNPAGNMRRRWVVGRVQSLQPTFPGDIAAWSRVSVSCVDLLADLARAELRDLLTEQTLVDGAAMLWLLDDPAGATAAAESSRYTVDPLRPAGNLAQIGWAGGTGLPYDGLSSLRLNSDIEAARGYLTGSTGAAAGFGWTMAECWFTVTADALHLSVFETPILLHSVLSSGQSRVVYLTDAGKLRQNGSTAESKVVADGQVHHLLYLYDPTFNSFSLECDGVSFSSPSVGGADALVAGPTINVGGFPAGALTPANGWANAVAWPGTISRVAIGSTASRAAWRQHYSVGTVMQETTRNRILRLLSYVSAPTVTALADLPVQPTAFGNYRWYMGLAGAGTKFADVLVGPQETQGQSVLTALLQVMRLEGGRMWTHQVDDRGEASPADPPTYPSVVVFGGRGTFRPSVPGVTLELAGDLEGQPGMDRSATRRVSIVTASSRTVSVTIGDTVLRAAIGNVSATVSAPAANEADLLYLAQDRMSQAAAVRLRLTDFTADPITSADTFRSPPFATTPWGPQWAALLALAPGDRVRLIGLPVTQLGFGWIDAYVLGGNEVHSNRGGLFHLSTTAADSPAELLVGDDLYGRVSSNRDLAVSTAFSDTATSLVVKFGSVGLSVDAGDYPMDLGVQGERVTVTAAPAGSTSPQTVAITRGINGTAARAHAIDELVDVWLTPVASW